MYRHEHTRDIFLWLALVSLLSYVPMWCSTFSAQRASNATVYTRSATTADTYLMNPKCGELQIFK